MAQVRRTEHGAAVRLAVAVQWAAPTAINVLLRMVVDAE
eukprot:COSAG01_NODE_8871_length_2631_cov_1.543049_1_plen_39_part_10